MNVTDGTSSTGIEPGEEKLKTFGDYLNEAEKLYKKCKPLIESYTSVNTPEMRACVSIEDNDDDGTIVVKVNKLLSLHKQLKDAMDICQAKENIDKALARGKTKKAQQLKSAIDMLFEKATGLQFQFETAVATVYKAILIESLWDRYEEPVTGASNASKGRVISSTNRLGKLMEKAESPRICFWEAIKASINFEKRFSTDRSTVGVSCRVLLGRLRKSWEGDALSVLHKEVRERVDSLNAHQFCIRTPAHSVKRQFTTAAPDEGIAESIALLENVSRSVRDVIDYDELVSDPQTLQMDTSLKGGRISTDEYATRLNQLTTFQALLALWRSTELVKPIDAGKRDKEFKESILRIDEAVRKLTSQIMACYPNVISDQRRATFSDAERDSRLPVLEKSCEVIASECHRLAGGGSKRIAEILEKLGDALDGAAENLSKELDMKGLRILFSDAELKEFVDSLFDPKAGLNIGDIARGEENVVEGDDEGPFHHMTEEMSLHEAASREERADSQDRADESEAPTDSAGREMTSGSARSAKEQRAMARLAQEVEETKKENERRKKAIKEEKRKLENAAKKLAESIERVERFKQAFNQGAYNPYLACDLEHAPKEVAKHAQTAQNRALNIAAKLEALEEFSISKGAVSEEAHRIEISEYRRKAVEYEDVIKRCDSDAKTLRIALIKADLSVESLRKSNAAKKLLIKLIDLEKGSESIKVTRCKTLPHCPQAKNKFGIWEMKEGLPLYDHVVEFRVELEKGPEFAVHFHFQAASETGKTADYYMDRMDIHDWNVQALQKQEMEEKIRAPQREGGKTVLVALHQGWKRSLEINRVSKKEIAACASATPGSTASALLSSKPKNKKGRARGK